MEEGAHKIRVLMDCDQVYSPILGESSKEKPKMIWQEFTTFCSFSYSLLNQKRGFMLLQKVPPPLMLFCDRRKYFMMKLQTNRGRKPPDDPIYNLGANIVPISCQKFRNVDQQQISSEIASEVKASIIIASTSEDDVTDEVIEDLQPEPSKHFLNHEEPPRKRRKNDDIQKNQEVFKCPHCTKTLTRKQTLRDHIHKFHPQHSKELVEEKIETKKTSVENIGDVQVYSNGNAGQYVLSSPFLISNSTIPGLQSVVCENGGPEVNQYVNNGMWHQGVQITNDQQQGLSDNSVQQTDNDPCFYLLDELEKSLN